MARERESSHLQKYSIKSKFLLILWIWGKMYTTQHLATLYQNNDTFICLIHFSNWSHCVELIVLPWFTNWLNVISSIKHLIIRVSWLYKDGTLKLACSVLKKIPLMIYIYKTTKQIETKFSFQVKYFLWHHCDKKYIYYS